MQGNVKKKEIAPVGPEAPPSPSEVESRFGEAEPMAVANDKQSSEDSFMPTTARHEEEPMDRELAAKYRVDKSGQSAVQESFEVGGRASKEKPDSEE